MLVPQSHPLTSRKPNKMGLKDAVVVATDPQEEVPAFVTPKAVN